MYWTTKALMTCSWQRPPKRNNSHLLKSICVRNFTTARLLEKRSSLCTQVTSAFSAAMQPESSSLLQIESSLPACAAKQLSTALQAINAALIYTECCLDFHYNARCHSCFSFGELGSPRKLELITMLHWFQGTLIFLLSRAAASWSVRSSAHMRATVQQLYQWINGLCGQWGIVLIAQGCRGRKLSVMISSYTGGMTVG